MKKNRHVGIIIGTIGTIITIIAPIIAHSVSYSPLVEEHRQFREKAVMKVGTILYLFHSGTPDVVKAIVVHDVLSVYRETLTCEMKEMGKIKILSPAGEAYVKAVVVEGEVRHDDIAKKGAVSFLVMLPEERCKGQGKTNL